MIELNIIKGRLESFRKKRIIFSVFLIYFAGLIFLMGVLSLNILFNRTFIKKTLNEIEAIKQKLSADSEKIAYIKENEKEMQTLLKGMDFFIEESDKRIQWAPILTFVGERIPAGVWLERFVSKEDTSQAEKKGEKAILISGYILPGIVNEREVIDRMVRTLSSGDIFSTVSLKDVKKVVETENNIELLTFQIECRLKQKRGAGNVAKESN